MAGDRQTVDDSIVMSLDVHGNNPTLIWAQLGADYNTVTPAQRSSARIDFLTFVISNEEPYIVIKLRYDELLRKVTVRHSATYLYIIKDNNLVGQSCHLRLPNNWRVLLC